ncbi:hypothetical protein [Pseudomonas sp. GV071]|uniref:hypothetical protein n=1 Tax=Pseudomonas sp. GV071 TaxID=2135754 RepID=UPI000D34629F|nr:hypothetical protein [Pseudomonas sp. GV071]PTQ66491.1 hypothetical protein C8K61_12211 [Pseudomonas sp. GV071]
MMLIRPLGLLLAMLLLGACDKDPTPPKTPPTPQPPAVTQAAEPVAAQTPAAKPSAKPASANTPKPFEPLVKSKLEPLPEAPEKKQASTAQKPAEVTASPVRTPQPPDKIQRLQVAKPQTEAQKKASDAVKQAKVEKPTLNLHLPKDAVKKLEPEVAAFGASEPTPSTTEPPPALLPQLFGDKTGEQSSFEMGGRVITSDHLRDQDKDAGLLDTVDGAELQFKFRH